MSAHRRLAHRVAAPVGLVRRPSAVSAVPAASSTQSSAAALLSRRWSCGACDGYAASVRRAMSSSVLAAAASTMTTAPSPVMSRRCVSSAAGPESPATTSCVSSGEDTAVAGQDRVTAPEERETRYSSQRHVEEAEAALREVYGPFSKVVLHRIPQRRRHTAASRAVEEENDVESGLEQDADGAESPGQPQQQQQQQQQRAFYYRVSATFRLLGFPVELAVANGPRAAETIEACLHQALTSDITFIHVGGSRGNAHGSSKQQQQQQRRSGGAGGNRNRGQQQQQQRQQQRDGAHANASGAFDSPSQRRLSPHQQELRAIMDDLRQLCAHFSRSLKLAIKPPARSSAPQTTADKVSGGGAEAEAVGNQWRCRGYVKEEWSTSPQARPAHEACGSSPNDALVRCVAELRQQYRAEMDSADVTQEGVREVAAIVQGQRKTVTATLQEERSGGGGGGSDGAATEAEHGTTGGDAAAAGAHLLSFSPTPSLMQAPSFSTQLLVTDTRGNASVYSARRQASPYAGYQTAAVSAIRAESVWDGDTHLLSPRLAPAPLLVRLRWQFDMLVDHICRTTGRSAAEVAWVQLGDVAGSGTSDAPAAEAADPSGGGTADPGPGPGGDAGTMNLPIMYSGAVYAERNTLVWQAIAVGRYRVEFDTYVQAVYYLLDQYSDCLASLPCMAPGHAEGALFPSAAVLELQVARHDGFPVLSNHRGKWTCYAILGTLTMQYLGCPYQTHYHFDAAATEWVSTVTVNNGRQTNFPLAQRRSRIKGEAWRLACLAALRDNFPRQYAAVIEAHPDVDLSNDAGARSHRFRALPREKRIAHISSFLMMVMTFAEEDLGWRQPRIRLRNQSGDIGLPQWVAEMEAQVQGEEGRRVVAMSPAFSQARQARRSLVYRVGMQYFPSDVKAYKMLDRGDCVDPEEDDAARLRKFYDPTKLVNGSMVRHVTTLIERDHATMAPVTWTLEAHTLDPGSHHAAAAASRSVTAAEEGSGADDSDLVTDFAEGDISLLLSQQPEMLLRPLRLSYTAQVLGARGSVLIADYDSTRAAAVADAEAVPVLVTALKSASFHLAGGDAETLWTEYETYPLDGISSTKGLCLTLFNKFFGEATEGEAAAAATDMVDGVGVPADGGDGRVDPLASISVVATAVGSYWIGTAVLPRFGMIPLAKAVSTAKRSCVRDALLLATRRSFPRVLQYIVRQDTPLASLATIILTEPVVEELPPAARREALASALREKRGTPPPPFRLLMQCMREAHPKRDHCIRVHNAFDTARGFQTRLYLQRGRIVRQGGSQVVGYGTSVSSATEALNRAAIVALENLFDAALLEAERKQPDYRADRR